MPQYLTYADSGESRDHQPKKPKHQGVNFQPSKRGQFSAAVDRAMNITFPTIAAVSIALILVPTASADPIDDAFLRDLANAGITHFPYPLVQEGHSICHTIDLGPSGGGYVPDLLDRLSQTFHQWLTQQQTADLVVDSVLAYCPYDRDKLNF
jgi:Protein of unknown function (DUF732)